MTLQLQPLLFAASFASYLEIRLFAFGLCFVPGCLYAYAHMGLKTTTHR